MPTFLFCLSDHPQAADFAKEFHAYVSVCVLGMLGEPFDAMVILGGHLFH